MLTRCISTGVIMPGPIEWRKRLEIRRLERPLRKGSAGLRHSTLPSFDLCGGNHLSNLHGDDKTGPGMHGSMDELGRKSSLLRNPKVMNAGWTA